MKFFLRATCSSLLLLSHIVIEGSEHPSFDSVAAEIRRSQGNDSLSQALKLPTDEAISLLGYYALEGDSPRRETATALLREIHGLREYMKDHVATAKQLRKVDHSAFDLMTLIATAEAASAVAPLLFDFEILTSSPDVSRDVNAFAAVASLRGMNIVDAPQTTASPPFKVSDIVRWQQWAIESAYVPADWVNKVGSDPLFRRLLSIDRFLSEPKAFSSRASDLPSTSAARTNSHEHAVLSGASKTSTPLLNTPSLAVSTPASGSPLRLLGAFIALVFLGLSFVFVRRRLRA